MPSPLKENHHVQAIFVRSVSGRHLHVVGRVSGDLHRLENSTISGNDARIAGGIHVEVGELRLINSTVATNSGLSGGALTVFNSIGQSALVHIDNSLIANNLDVAGDCSRFGINTTIHAAHTLIGSGLGCINGGSSGNLSGDPMIAALADNGGATPTHALLAGSPAIDAGDDSRVPAGDRFDQRGPGFARISGSAVDIGALEVQVAGGAGVLAINKQIVGGPGAGALDDAQFYVRLECDGMVLAEALGLSVNQPTQWLAPPANGACTLTELASNPNEPGYQFPTPPPGFAWSPALPPPVAITLDAGGNGSATVVNRLIVAGAPPASSPTPVPLTTLWSLLMLAGLLAAVAAFALQRRG